MLKIQKLSCLAIAVSAVVSGTVFAEEKAAFDEKEASYAVGVLMGAQAKDLIDSQNDIIAYDKNRVLEGVKAALEGKVDLHKDEKIQKTLGAIEEKLVAAAKAKVTEEARKAKESGEKYRTEFAKQAGVNTTKSGLLYKVVEAGKGEPIKSTDIVKVHYTGRLTDGTVFDSSVERGQPAEFKLNEVVKGWTEGLQLIKKGGKIELVLPPELAYGEDGAGRAIPPNSTLYFEVEILDVNPKAAK